MSEHDARMEFSVEGYEKFGDVARVMGRVDRNFPKWIQQEIKREAKQLSAEAKKSIQGQRAGSKKQTGILNTIAAGIGTEEISEDDEFGWMVTTSMPEENEQYLPRGFDTSWGGFNHPVFAKKDTPRYLRKWEHQDGKYDWWVRVMGKAQPDLEPKLQDVLDRGAKEIAAAAQEKD
jgi:putative lipoic acid-binding regulatory protein